MKRCYIIKEGIFAAAIADLAFPEDLHLPGYLITRINVMTRFRRQGYGTRILRQILRDADAEGATLLLQPQESDPNWTKWDLITWYERYGFRYNPKWYMERRPNQNRPQEDP